MRQIILDTETTGIDPKSGHRIIEIGCVEMVNRRLTGNHFHVYINPNREVEAEAMAVHGITNEFLADKPLFAEIAQDFFAFIKGAELVIHNAPFDVGFINHEFALLNQGLEKIETYCQVLDTLVLARQMHPGQRNSLDALCRRYFVDNSGRDLHGALLDAEILAEVYLAMTGGQVDLALTQKHDFAMAKRDEAGIRRLSANRKPFKVVRASEQEMAEHQAYLETMKKTCGDKLVWH